MEEYKVRECCAICDNKQLETIIKYGKVPLAGDFPKKEDFPNEKQYNMDLQFCPNCGLLQTNSVIDAGHLFKDYRYMSSIGLTKHFTSVASYLKDKFNLTVDSNVVEIGSNDGVLLRPLMDLGIKPIGVEPSTNISQIAKDKGCTVINDFFTEFNGARWFGKNNTDLVVSNNCFAHIDNIKGIVEGVHYILKPEGHFVVEVHYLKSLIEGCQFDNIYHEHIYYYSLIALNNLFSQFGMTIVDFEEIPIHAGSIRVIIKNSVENVNPKVQERYDYEKSLGLDNLNYFKEFANDVTNSVEKIKNELQTLKDKGFKIAGYGASGRANMLANMADLTPELIEYIVDESPERCGRYIAGKHIPIVSKEHLLANKPDYIVIFAWNFAKMIMEKLEGNNFNFIIPLPEFKIVKNYSELENFISI